MSIWNLQRAFRSNLYCVDENSWTRYANSVVDGQLFCVASVKRCDMSGSEII